MTSIRKDVKQRVIERLRTEQKKARFSIDKNRRTLNALSGENTKLKRELAEIENIIRGLL